MFNFFSEPDNDKNDKKARVQLSTSEDCDIINEDEVKTPKVQSFDSISELEALQEDQPPMSPIQEPIIVPIQFPTQTENAPATTQHEMPVDDMLGVIGEGFYRAGEFMNNRLNDVLENGGPSLLGFFHTVQSAVQSLGDLASNNDPQTTSPEPIPVTPPQSPSPKNVPN